MVGLTSPAPLSTSAPPSVSPPHHLRPIGSQGSTNLTWSKCAPPSAVLQCLYRKFPISVNEGKQLSSMILPSLILCTHPNLGSPIGKQFPWPHIDWSSSHAPMLLRVLATCCRFRVSNECRRWENGRAFELQPCLDADQGTATLQTIQYQRSKPLKNPHVYILDPHRLSESEMGRSPICAFPRVGFQPHGFTDS